MPVEMVVYKGFDHGITKPKVMRAVMTHKDQEKKAAELGSTPTWACVVRL